MSSKLPTKRPDGLHRAAVPSVLTQAKTAFRSAFAKALYHTGGLNLIRRVEGSCEVRSDAAGIRLRRSLGSKFGILCYHRIGTEGVPYHSRLAPAVFEAQMRYVSRRYRIVSLAQLFRELQSGEAVPPTLAITFDDGYRDLYTFAFPVLARYGVPAAIYLIGECMETGESPWYDRIFAALQAVSSDSVVVETHRIHEYRLSSGASRAAAAWDIVCYLRTVREADRKSWCAEFERRVPPSRETLRHRMLDWNQVREMQRGGISFGAHTMSHPSVGQLEASAYCYELDACKELLERELEVPVEDFAYPFGKVIDSNNAVEAYLGRAGYRSAVTTLEGFNTPSANPLRLRRLQIGDGSSLPEFAFNIARMFLQVPSDDRADWEEPSSIRDGIGTEISETMLPRN